VPNGRWKKMEAKSVQQAIRLSVRPSICQRVGRARYFPLFGFLHYTMFYYFTLCFLFLFQSHSIPYSHVTIYVYHMCNTDNNTYECRYRKVFPFHALIARFWQLTNSHTHTYKCTITIVMMTIAKRN